MRLFSSLLTFPLLHSLRFVSGRLGWETETGPDWDLNGEIVGPTPTQTPDRDEFKHGYTLMETRLGYPSNGTTRRDLALGSRQISCSPGYVAACPSNPQPCCPLEYTVCCKDSVCCGKGTFCVGLITCCIDGQVGCTNPDGCCPAGSKCCGLYCCPQGYECRSGTCVNPALNSLSVAYSLSVQSERSRLLDSISARQSSLESVASVSSKSIESEASVASEKLKTPTLVDSPTTTTSNTGNGNGNSNSNVALVGGVVGACLGATVLVLIGVLLWRRTGRVTTSSQSIHPATSASLAFSTNSNHIGGPPVSHAAQPGWHPQQSSLFALPSASAPAAAQAQASIPSQQSASPPLAVRMWLDRHPTTHQETHRRLASHSRSLASYPPGGPADPRGLYSDALRGATSSVAAPVNVPSSASRPLSHVPPYSFVPERAEFSG